MADRNTEDTLKSLSDSYADADYGTVVKILLENKDLFNEGVFHYNLGTAYLKQGNLPVARFNLEKALDKGYVGPHLFKNLSTVKSNISANTFEKPSNFKDSVFLKSFQVPVHYFHTLSLLLILALALCLRFKKIKKAAFATLFIFTLLPAIYGVYLDNSYQQAILLNDVVVYEGPSKAFDKSTEIPGGIKIIIKKADDNWLFIQSPNYYSGWIERAKLGIL